ncbi:response regulator [Oceanospirillaceae bacterium]|uniref:response regulator n=1 Tax=Candidatus Njordibacter sp. Uisw_002 TaxID=3230971 RepID=UPI00233795AA|nr:response regulator [Oceanospirillaceae bacterium]MDB9752913.1 response regulator [Oceanospirillaceae bacterium]MDB9957768.1 response regulator [Oceanospirillaceae bacterium]MDC1341609.1 response regulator [Oceanospirillaceae bacterium]
MAKHIVIVEDDQDQRDNYQFALEQRGYQVTAYAGKDEAESGLKLQRPDLVILDIIMHDNIDAGFQLCAALLKIHPELPVLFLTERIGEIDRILGLRMGAWDYQPKPVSLDFLAEKVATLVRLGDIRIVSAETNDQKVKDIGHLQLLEESRQAKWQGQEILGLTLTEFRMIEALTRRPGNILTYDTLAQATHQHYVSNNTISTHIRNIKRKIKLIDTDFDAIKSEYGMGYRWSDR